MRCLYYSYCNEPKYLCCNFCSDTKCEVRCKDDHNKCKLYEQGLVEIDPEKTNHIVKEAKKRINQIPDTYYFRDEKNKASLYKRFGKYISIKDNDKLPSNTFLAIMTKNRAEKKLEELNKETKQWVLIKYTEQ